MQVYKVKKSIGHFPSGSDLFIDEKCTPINTDWGVYLMNDMLVAFQPINLTDKKAKCLGRVVKYAFDI